MDDILNLDTEFEPFDDIQPFTELDLMGKTGVAMKIISVECGFRSSAVVTDRGYLFVWGVVSSTHVYPRPSL